MYDKHKYCKVVFQVIVNNQLSVEFNTAQKRDTFVQLAETMPRYQITCITNCCYPWNPTDGLHGLKSPNDFATLLGISPERVGRAIKNGFLQTEPLGDEQYIVNDHDHYRIKGIVHSICGKEELSRETSFNPTDVPNLEPAM